MTKGNCGEGVCLGRIVVNSTRGEGREERAVYGVSRCSRDTGVGEGGRREEVMRKIQRFKLVA